MNDRNSVNKVILVGNLGNKPEERDVNGRTVANFSIATNEAWTDGSGQKQERTQWHRVAAWGKLGEICARHLDKGRKVYIEGRLNYRDAERDGVKVRYTDIVASTVHFLDSRGSGDYSGDSSSSGNYSNNDSGYASNNPPHQNQSRSNYNSGGGGGSSSNYNSPVPSPPDDDDIPF